MASAWLDIAVDWENPNGWNIPELINIIVDAYNERKTLSDYNTDLMPAFVALLSPSGEVLNDDYLADLNSKLEFYLTSTQNISTEIQADYIPWNTVDFLAHKALPANLIPVDFTGDVFNYQWITYWFYILNETNLMGAHEFTTGFGNDGKIVQNGTVFSTAVSDFVAVAYASIGTAFFGSYNYKTNLGIEDHDLSQGELSTHTLSTKDKDNLDYEIPLNTYCEFWKLTAPVGSDLMDWSANDGDIFDITSQVVWSIANSQYEGVAIRLPTITPLINGSTIADPGFYRWGTREGGAIRDITFNHVSDLNDANLITYTPIV